MSKRESAGQIGKTPPGTSRAAKKSLHLDEAKRESHPGVRRQPADAARRQEP